MSNECAEWQGRHAAAVLGRYCTTLSRRHSYDKGAAATAVKTTKLCLRTYD